MSTTIGGAAKLQFYPTDVIETFKMFPMIFPIKLRQENRAKIREELGDVYRDIFTEYADMEDGSRIDFAQYLYIWLLDNNRMDLLRYIDVDFFIGSRGEKLVVADLFAGKGKWLETFKYFGDSKRIHLIANELEKNRYEEIESNPLIDEHYNGSFEELQLPKKCVSTMLFNPPYGGSEGIRNVKRYFNMTIEREYISKDGLIIMVLRNDDILDIAEELTINFKVNFSTIYRVHADEFKKYKQFVVYAKLRDKPLDLDNRVQFEQFQGDIEELKSVIAKESPQSYVQMNHSFLNRPEFIEHTKIRENFKVIKNSKKYVSDGNNKNWDWIRDITELKDVGSEKLTIPKQPKTGELSLIMASGYINGKISKADGSAEHIVIGGVKNLIRENTVKELDEDGVEIEKTVVTRYSKPYLNLLINNGENVEIKELRECE